MTERLTAILESECERGSYRMNLLACVAEYVDDVAWLRQRVARLERVNAARLEAGHVEAIFADPGLAAFERRWRVRVDVRLAAVGRSARRPASEPILECCGDNLYMYDNSLAIAARVLTVDLAWHLVRQQAGSDLGVILDRRAPRRAAEPLLAALAYRHGQERHPTFRPGTAADLEADRVIVTACATGRASNFAAVVGGLNPQLAADLGYVAGARRPPTAPPSTLTRAQRAAWRWNLDRWTKARTETYRRWERLKPWVEPAPSSVAMRDWSTAMGTADRVQDNALVFTHWDEATGPVLEQQRGSRQLLPGESAKPPTAQGSRQRRGERRGATQHRQSAKTNKRR
jgi:hypothetical protein